MAIKRRVLLASGIGNKRLLTLETGGVIDDKHIKVGVLEGTEPVVWLHLTKVVCLHLTKRELLRNVIDLCEEIRK